jgi:hypothetical protein
LRINFSLLLAAQKKSVFLYCRGWSGL